VQEEQDFLVLRYSLVEEPQRAIAPEALPKPKGAAILAAVDHDREFIINGVRYSFVGFAEAQPTAHFSFPSSRFLVGKTAKLKKAHMGKKVPGDIVETQEDDWLPVLTVFDLEGQYIFVKKDWRFGTPEQTMRAIQGGLREPVMARYNHRIFVEGRTKKEHFWRVVSSHRRFYKLELKLISPNILETNLRAREALAALKELFSQDEVGITLTNESGDLEVPEEPVSDYLEYIEEGEGSWGLTTEGDRGGKKKHSSSENTDTVELPVPEEGVIEEERQLELETGKPAPARSLTDARMVAEVFSAVSNFRER
jgi:hypothetical protein